MTKAHLPKSHDHLVDSFVKDLKPVKRASARVYFLVWFVPCLTLATIATFIVGYNGDLSEKFSNLSFVITLFILLLGAVTASWLAIKMSIPGEEPPKRIRYFLTFMPLLLGVAVLIQWISMNSWQSFIASASGGVSCGLSIVLVAFFPLIFLGVLSGKLAPMNSFGTAVMVALAALFLSALGGQVHCCTYDGCHLAIWHYLPVFFGCLVIAIPLQYLLARWKNK